MKSFFYVMFIFCFSLLLVPTANAEFSVPDKSWPKQLPESEYNTNNYYGNSKNVDFYHAVEKPTEMSAAEKDTINQMMPSTELNRFYLKAGIYNRTLKISSIKNNSDQSSMFYRSPLAESKTSKDDNGYLFGLGYNGQTWRMDAEIHLKQKLDYNKNPLFSNSVDYINSSVTSNNVMANFYWDFQEIYVFKPFVGLGVGLGINKTATTLNNEPERIKNYFTPNYSLQFGIRSRLLNSDLFVNAGYRYIMLGSTRWLNNMNTIDLKGNLISSGFSLDLSYLL